MTGSVVFRLDLLARRWEISSLGELCSILGGHTCSKPIFECLNDFVPWLSSKGIKSYVVSTGKELIILRALNEMGLKVCQPGSEVVVVPSGTLAHTYPVAVTASEAAAWQSALWLRGRNRIEGRQSNKANRKHLPVYSLQALPRCL